MATSSRIADYVIHPILCPRAAGQVAGVTTPHLFPAPMPGGDGHAVALARAADDDAAAARAARRALCAAHGPMAREWTTRRHAGAARTVMRGNGTAVAAVLSVSHHAGRAAALVAPPGWRVGVDLARHEGVTAAHARYFLDQDERRAAATLGLVALWALKEAAWKALALDAGTPFGALRLRFDDGALPVAAVARGRAHDATAGLATPWRGWVLAAVWLSPPSLTTKEAA